MFKKKTEKSNFNETVHEEHSLILGVGMPKCGTTAIENYLLRSNDYLMENGYEYPNLEYELVARDMEVPPCKGIYDNGNGGVFIQYYRKNQPAPRDHIYEKLWEIIKEKLKYRNVILVSEDFWQSDCYRVVKDMKSHVQDTKVICYLRRQDLYIESSWNQGIKEGIWSWSFTQYIHILHIDEECGYLKKIQAMEEALGGDTSALSIGAYERSQLKNGSVINDFLDRIHIPGREEESAWGNERNERLCGELLDIKRFINSLTRDGEIQKRLLRYIEIYIHQTGDERECYFSPELRKEILRRFSEQNAQIARRYLHREDGRLFCDSDTVPYPVHEDKTVDPRIEEKLIKMAVTNLLGEIGRR